MLSVEVQNTICLRWFYSTSQLLFISYLSILTVCEGQNPPNYSNSNYREKLGLPSTTLQYMPLKSDTISVSGHSSGAAAATNFYLSHSNMMDGLAIFSSIHYQCGNGGIFKLMPCIFGRGNTSESVEIAKQHASYGLIDPLENLMDKRHYIFHGTLDTFIHFDNGLKVAKFFNAFSEHVKFEQFNAIHSVPSKTCGIQCSGIPSNFGTGCSKCHFSVVFDGLNYIYRGKLVESTATTCRTKHNNDGLVLVDQEEFISPMEKKVSMLPDAVLYTPPQCRVNSSRCSLHVAFHGCRHSIQNDGIDYIKCSGYLETADANNFIVLFPQVKQSYAVHPITLFQCWDLFGYSGPLYGTKLGSQTEVVHRMVNRIMNMNSSSSSDSSSSSNVGLLNSSTISSWIEDYYYDILDQSKEFIK